MIKIISILAWITKNRNINSCQIKNIIFFFFFFLSSFLRLCFIIILSAITLPKILLIENSTNFLPIIKLRIFTPFQVNPECILIFFFKKLGHIVEPLLAKKNSLD